MHKRAARRDNRAVAGRPKVTIVTTSWGNHYDERYFATRSFAGAASAAADITIVHLTSSTSSHRPARDGAFRLVEISSSPARRSEEAILLAALKAADRRGRVPEIAGPGLHSLQGGRSNGLAAHLDEAPPDVLVVAGLNQGWDAGIIESITPRPTVVVLPLMGDDPRLGVPGYREFLQAADTVCTVSPGEHDRVLGVLAGLEPRVGRQPRAEVMDLRLNVAVNTAAAAHRLVGLSHFDNFVVFLRGFPPGTAEHAVETGYRRFRHALPGVGIADISNERWRTYGDDFDYTVPTGPSRVNLWRLLSQAIVLVDFRPGGLLGREAIESLLIGTPLLLPVSSTARHVIEESGGGFVYRDDDELLGRIASLTDPMVRKRLVAAGRDWAARVHGDRTRFVSEVTNCVLGASRSLA